MYIAPKITVSVLLCIALCGASFAQLVEIPDPNLRRAVREALNLPAGTSIMQADMQQLTGLSASDRQISDLTGLEHAVNLTDLGLGSNNISDLTPLAGLVKLKVLWLWNNPLSDLFPLANLTNLEKLDFAGCQISDIVPLSNLTQLTTLILRHNRISNLTPLAELIELEDLLLWSNPCSDLSPLKNLTNLKTADLSECQISDITALSKLTQLTTLKLSDNRILDISPLADLTQLSLLRLNNNRIEDISPLANLMNLIHLEIQNNRIIDIAPLANLANLEYLDTNNNPIFDPNSPPVEIPDQNLRQAVRDALNLRFDIPVNQANMRQLTSLDARQRQIADLTGLEHATNLDRLDISFNPVFNLTPLANLMGLKYLDASYCNISDITPISGLSQLTGLGLKYNIITDIRPLANFTQLTKLQLDRNNISDIEALANLSQLVELQLTINRISDVAPLANLRQLESLDIRSNSITDLSPLDSLSLIHLEYDQYCDIAPLPLEPRLSNRTYPSVFGANWLFGYDSRIDLIYGGPLEMYWRPDGKLAGALEDVIHRRDELIAMNPNMVFLVEIKWATDKLLLYGEDWPYWLRDTDRNVIVEDNRNPKNPVVFIDFTQPGAQDLIVQKAVDVSKCGLFDGIVFDSWGEHVPLLPRHLYGLDSGTLAQINEMQQQAKLNIVRRIRAATYPNFLIQVNSNRSQIPLTGPYINGLSMKRRYLTRFSANRSGFTTRC